MLVYSSAMSSSRHKGNTTRCPSSLLVLFLLLLNVVMVTMTVDEEDFSPSSYCRDACSVGQGGNVCQCTATKFAGKRNRMLPLSPVFDGSLDGRLALSDGGWSTHRHVKSRLRASRHDRRHHAASRWIGSRFRQSGINERNFIRAKFDV